MKPPDSAAEVHPFQLGRFGIDLRETPIWTLKMASADTLDVHKSDIMMYVYLDVITNIQYMLYTLYIYIYMYQ